MRESGRKTESYLHSLVENTRSEGRERLPTIASIARTLGVSTKTVHAAVGRLKRQGVLRAGPRRGIRVCPLNPLRTEKTAGGDTRSAVRPGPRWRRVHASLAAQILSGGDSTLPSIKDIASVHGVARATAAKAVARLLDQGLVTHDGRGYRACVPRVPVRASTIVLVARGSVREGVFPLTEHRLVRLRHLESLCAGRGVGLVVHPVEYARFSEDIDRLDTLLRRETAGPVLGCLVWPTALADTVTAPLYRVINALSFPIAILVESTDLPGATALDDRPGVRLFQGVDNVAAGHLVARHLLALGHRRLAYVYPAQAPDWSRERLEGLRAECRNAHIGAAVVPVAVGPLTGRLSAALRQRQRETERILSRRTNALTALLRSRLEHRLQEDLTRAVDAAMRQQALRDRILTALDSRSLADIGITAIVGANDAIAIDCIDAIRLSGREIPRDFSVAGFDDSTTAARMRLTSHNRDLESTNRAMVQHILLDLRDTKDTNVPSRFSGTLTVRESTAEPRSTPRW